MRITPPVTEYRSPTPRDLQDLKEQFGLTAYEMARLFAVQPDQWRKHTGGQVNWPPKNGRHEVCYVDLVENV